jgi:hypothetical protein
MRDKMKQTKTKKVDGVDLWPPSFAYVGDPEDTNSWKFPIHFPSDEAKTRNHIKNGLHRFDDMKNIPQNERATVWLTLIGAAKAHGVKVEQKPKRLEAEIKAVELNKANTVLTDAELALVIADADRRTDAMLRSLGLE